MAKVQSMTIREFMQGTYKEETLVKRFITHLERNKIAYRIIGTTIIVFVSGVLDVSAFASSGIDVGGKKIYGKLLDLAKWVIIIKGGWDTINHTVKGDFDHAKRSFFSYIIVYVILLGLPWALDEVDGVFKSMGM